MRFMRRWMRASLFGTMVLAIAFMAMACDLGVEEEGTPLPDDGFQDDGGTPTGDQGTPIGEAGVEEGSVASVNPDAETLSVQKTTGETVEVQTGEATIITVDGVTAGLEDVQEGAQVEVTLDQETNMATEVRVTSEQAGGTLEPIGTATAPSDGMTTPTPDGTIEPIGTATAPSDGMTTPTPDGTIEPIGTATAPSDGMTTPVPDGTLEPIGTATAPGDGTATPASDGTMEPEGEEAEGTITGIDPGTGVVRVETATGDPLLLHLTQETEFRVNGQAGNIASLSDGSSVRVVYDPLTYDILLIEANFQS